ncbi:glycosyltransferase 87 family protein [Gulosibacter chungangensis]|uniref:glycosyltransferase 87 family protein n=1 Tax=Gulosibacter chungangensis TaxID=979746 RepID=UPI0017877DAD|nr:glycosyltransferase 87 family protein [Gulosibacter chungangensis]
MSAEVSRRRFSLARPKWFGVNFEIALIWGAMALVHLLYGWVGSWHASVPFNDVTSVYRGWLDGAIESGSIPGIHEPFVYPVAALLPMWLTDLVGGHEHYTAAWIIIVLVLNLVALWWLTGRNRHAVGAWMRRAAAWFWVAFMFAIGPIGLGRIDSITVPIVILALLTIRQRTMGAGFAMTFGAWLKIWPAAPFAAAFVVFRRRWRLVIGAVIACGVVLLPIMLFVPGWSIENLASFITGQTGRGLQVESFAASILLMMKAFGAQGYFVGFNREILTTQISGPGTLLISDVLTPLMFIVMAALLVYAVMVKWAGSRLARLFPSLTMALVTTFILVNKVGSPQFFVWLAPVVIIGLLWDGRWFRWIALIALIVAGLTQIIYPWYYGWVTAAIPWAAFTLLLRNLLVLGLLVASIGRMWPAGGRKSRAVVEA